MVAQWFSGRESAADVCAFSGNEFNLIRQGALIAMLSAYIGWVRRARI